MEVLDHRGAIQNLPDELLLEIFQHMTLEELVMCIQNVNIRWRNVAHSSELWKNLAFKPPSRLSDDKIINMLKQMPQLRTFIFTSCCYKVDEIIDVLCSHCKNLQTLICDYVVITTSHLQKILHCLHDLECFQMSQWQMIDETSLYILGKLKNLKKLTCVNVGPASTYIRSDKNVFQCLEHLEMIAYCTGDMLINEYERNILDECHFLYLVPHLKNLKHVYIDFRMLHFSGFKLFFCHFIKLHNLETLCFKSLFHSDRHILTRMFRSCSFTKLWKLDLSNCLNIDLKTVQAINKSCPIVRELHFNRCVNFDDDCIEALTGFPELLFLDMSCCNRVSDEGLSVLAQCPKLEVLDLSWRLIVPNSTLPAVSSLPNLKALILNHTQISHNEIKEFLMMNRRLEYLGLYCCSGVEENIIQAFVPHCKISVNRIHEVMSPYSKKLRTN